MAYSEVTVLIPCHSLEDFPTEQGDKPASSLLNAFAAAWHPAALALTGELPRWHRADEPPEPRPDQIFLIPTICEDWLPHGWVERAREAGAVVAVNLVDRSEWVAAVSEAVEADPELSADIIADFLALGTVWLEVELLTRRMRGYETVDHPRLRQRSVAAARSALAGDLETTETHLRACFECLLEARERIYPIECYLLDLCLLTPDVVKDDFAERLQNSPPTSLLVTGRDLQTIFTERPNLRETLAHAWTERKIAVVGGEADEAATGLMPLGAALEQLIAGHATVRELLGRAPKIWGRRRFGPLAQHPQLLTRLGMQAGLHLVLDDGIYPDSEYSKFRWYGTDDSIVDAISRIPLAADSASSYLRLPVRLSESMDHDQVAAVILARWPDVSAPWFEDLRRMQKFAPVLGRMVTLEQYFEQTEATGRMGKYYPREYFSPYLIQHVARREPAPISRYATSYRQWQQFEALDWCRAAAAAVCGQPIETDESRNVLRHIVAAHPDAETAAREAAAAPLALAAEEWPARLAKVVLHGAANGHGFLLLNPLSFRRRAVVSLPGLKSAPKVQGPIRAVQFSAVAPDKNAVVVDLPPCGFAWIPADERGPNPAQPKQPLAEAGAIRNELLEVSISEATGGISQIRLQNRRANRLSQQLSFRFPRERTIRIGEGDEVEVIKTQYAEARRLHTEVTSAGPTYGEVVTRGEIVDQTNSQRLATFRQTLRIWRGLPRIEVEIELGEVRLPEGDPWNNAFVSRFAWNDSTAAVTRSVLGEAHGFSGERVETLDYLEIAGEGERATIIPHGLPFHRKTGPRMLDTLLIVAGEECRTFRFTIAIDEAWPLAVARDATIPPLVVESPAGPPLMGNTGWLFSVDARNVQLLRVLEKMDRPTDEEPWEHDIPSTLPEGSGWAVQLQETEGQARTVRLKCYGNPTFARKRDLRGRSLGELTIDGDAVVIEMGPHELIDVELRFAAT